MRHYLKYQWKIVGLICSIIFIYVLILYLYGMNMMACVYPTLLCLVVCVIYFIYDYHLYKIKHQQLKHITFEGNWDILCESVFDKDYQNLFQSLKQEYSELKTLCDQRYYDMMDYYSVWVHQIKTPIASMRLTLQREDTLLSRQLQIDLSRIEQYVDMVLTYLRLDSLSTDYVFKKHDVDELIKTAIKKFSREFITRHLVLDYTPIDKWIITDEKWFLFVLEQILSNALKYTKDGGIHIFLKEDILCIEDSGIGIAREDLPRIFEKGYTGYNGREDKKASGIGLYLCWRVIQNLGLSIDVTSQVGQGTCVMIDLKQHIIKD